MKTILIFVALVLGAAGCTPGPQSAEGFRLPDGNAANGEDIFRYIGCQTCHSLVAEAVDPGRDDRMVLGGDITRVKTYGDLVTSIINPSHKISPAAPEAMKSDDGASLMEMANLNDKLTVTELIDLVAFLQGQYNVVPPDIQPYVYFYN